MVSLVALATSTYFGLTEDLFDWEVDITLWLQGFSMGPARFLRGWVFWMGVKGLAGGVMLIVFAFLWLQRLRIESIFLLFITLPDLFNFWLREIIGRPRPTAEMVEVLGGPQGFSFPSGTTLHMLLFYGFLLYLGGRYISSRRTVYVLWALGTLYILTSGLWVIYDGRHWFTDAIGGYLYGAFYLLVLIAAYKWTKSRIHRDQAFQYFSRLPRAWRKPVAAVVRIISVEGVPKTYALGEARTPDSVNER